MKKIILIFGHGYISQFLLKKLAEVGWVVYCTSRKDEHKNLLEFSNVKIINYFDPSLIEIIKLTNAILSSVPTDDEVIDPVLARYSRTISQRRFQWVGYLSSTGVYGNHDGKWVDEETKCLPNNLKSKIRLLAEQKWLALYFKYKIPVHIFRLSGIYGPGRNCLEEINNSKDFTIIKKDQFFSRVHVEDVCQAIISSLNFPTPGEIYNLSDDEPAPINVVHQFGAKILNKHQLQEIPFENANLSKQAKMFFIDNKKVSNDKIIQNLNIKLKYPDYRIGLLQGCLPYLH
ncbi:SDR family oxidoreductase [Rickettsia gravesii]|uniref:SDR family oxidoreductase n=1 Tax=Rickettsia gravesii TaxID=354585 RepID=UPI000368BBB1|nr:SDR family oxidoreductase [Rickettsia gravesii]